MKAINTQSLNQDEARTMVARLGLWGAYLRGILATRKSESLAPPTLAADDDIGNIELLVTHITEVEHRIGADCPQFQFAAALNIGGTRSAILPACQSRVFTPGAKSSGKPTITEQVLAARGVKTLAELNELPPRDIGD